MTQDGRQREEKDVDDVDNVRFIHGSSDVYDGKGILSFQRESG